MAILEPAVESDEAIEKTGKKTKRAKRQGSCYTSEQKVRTQSKASEIHTAISKIAINNLRTLKIHRKTLLIFT